MSATNLTLRRLFYGRTSAATLAARAPGVESHDSMLEVRQDFAEKLPDLPWHTVADEIDRKVDEILGLGIDDLLVGAWKAHERFRAYADPAKYPPTDTILTSLARHTIKSTYDPAIKILLAGAEVGSLDFLVELALELEGIALEIQGGRIRELEAGSCRATGTLQCAVRTRLGSKTLIKKRKATRKYRFGRLPLERGVKIPA